MLPPSHLPTLDPLDRRLAAARPDLADARLKGRVEAERFEEGTDGHVCVPVADMRPVPHCGRGIDHQLLFGEAVTVFDRRDGHAWVQSQASHYVGWVEETAIRTGRRHATHRVAVRCAAVHPDPALGRPPVLWLSAGSLVEVRATDKPDAMAMEIEGCGFVAAGHLSRLEDPAGDYVVEAGKFLGVPYLWGGTSAWGIDCSGLVYLAMQLCGRNMLRDSDMLAATAGNETDPGTDYSMLRRGDLVFWRGHVAIVEGDGNLLHANATNMAVTREPFGQALSRIAATFEKPIGVRRP